MFCMKCGKPTEGDANICPECAALQAQPAPEAQPEIPVQQPLYPEQPEIPVQQPAETFVLSTPEVTKKPKKPANKLLIAIIAVVTALAVGLGAFAGWPYISTFFYNMTHSDEEEASRVVQNAVTDTVKQFLFTHETGGVGSKKQPGLYTRLRNAFAEGSMETAADFSVNLKLNKTLLDTVVSAAGIPSDIDLSAFEDVTVEVKTNAKDDKVEVSLGAVIIGKTVLSADLVLDTPNETVYLRIPQLNDKWTSIEVPNMGSSMGEMKSAISGMGALLSVLPEEEVLIRLLEKYIPIALNELEAEKSSDTFKAGGVSQKLTEYEITEKAALSMVLAVLKEAKSDDDIKAICDDISDYVNDMYRQSYEQMKEYYDEYDMEAPEYQEQDLWEMAKEGISEAISYLQDYKSEASSKTVCEIGILSDAKGALCGLTLKASGQKAECFAVRSGNKYGFELSFPNDAISIEGEGKYKGDLLTAEYEIEAMGMEIGTIELKDFDLEYMTKGTVIIRPSEELISNVLGGSAAILSMGDPALELSFTSGETSTLCVAVHMGSNEFVRISLDSSFKDASGVSIPSGAISPDEWSEGLGMQSVADILEDAGIPLELFSYIGGAQARPAPEYNYGY